MGIHVEVKIILCIFFKKWCNSPNIKSLRLVSALNPYVSIRINGCYSPRFRMKWTLLFLVKSDLLLRRHLLDCSIPARHASDDFFLTNWRIAHRSDDNWRLSSAQRTTFFNWRTDEHANSSFDERFAPAFRLQTNFGRQLTNVFRQQIFTCRQRQLFVTKNFDAH